MNDKELKEIDRKVAVYRKHLVEAASKDSKHSISKIDREIKKVFKSYGNAYITKGAVAIFVLQALKVEVEDYLRINRKIESRMVSARIGEDSYLEMRIGSGYRLKIKKR